MHPFPRVVSVEDDQGIFNLIEATLRPLPVELYHARTGQEALEMVTNLKPDLIVLDIALPDIHGWDLLKQVKLMNCDQPEVLVLTAHTDPTHRVIGRLQNVNAYLFKPFVPAELRQSVKEILGLV